MSEEVWRAVVNYEGYYEVSNLGRVRSVTRVIVDKLGRKFQRKGRLLKLNIRPDNYQSLELSKDSNSTKHLVHRLVAQSFILNPSNKPCVNHINGNKSDNRVENLEWVTYSENSKHAVATGLLTARCGKDSNFSILSESDVLEITDLLDSGDILLKDIALKYGVTESSISAISTGRNWSELTDIIKSTNVRDSKVVNCRNEMFNSMSEAAKKFGIHRSNISKVCKGVQKTAGKYLDGKRVKWKLINNMED